MNGMDKTDEGAELKYISLTNPAYDSTENLDSGKVLHRLQTSNNSSISNDSEVSLLSLSFDKELANSIDIDELPAFEIRLISPLGRTPSPIDNEDIATATMPLPLPQERLTSSVCQSNPEYITLHDINAQISPPSDHENEDGSLLDRTSSLETIFEGVFLNTPPRQRFNLQSSCHNRSRTNLLEKVVLNRLNSGKENQSPVSKSEIHPSRRASTDTNCMTNTCIANSNYSF